MSWIQTFTGKRFDPVNPDVALIDIRDIARSLSMQCRFMGHCLRPYSIAEHSIRVSQLLEGATRKVAGLLHDASEAYLSDVASPLKRLPIFDGYRQIEARLQHAIYKRFGLDLTEEDLDAVKKADLILLATERRDLMAPCEHDWQLTEQPLTTRIKKYVGEPSIEFAFLRVFKILNEGE